MAIVEVEAVAEQALHEAQEEEDEAGGAAAKIGGGRAQQELSCKARFHSGRCHEEKESAERGTIA